MAGGSVEGFPEDDARHAESGAYNGLCDRPAVLVLMGDVNALGLLDSWAPGTARGRTSEPVARGAAEVVGFGAGP